MANQTKLRTLLNRVIQRVFRRLEREGLLIPDPEKALIAGGGFSHNAAVSCQPYQRDRLKQLRHVNSNSQSFNYPVKIFCPNRRAAFRIFILNMPSEDTFVLLAKHAL